MTARYLDYVGTSCPSVAAPALQEWYDRWHGPQGALRKGLESVTRYRFVAPGGDSRINEYPDFLTLYTYADADAFRAWNAGAARREAMAEFDALRPKGIEPWWRAQYDILQSWKTPSTNTLISMTALHCGPEGAPTVDRWYTEKHVPDLLEFDEMLGVTRYRLAEDQVADTPPGGPARITEYPRFLTIYNYPDMATVKVFDTSPARLAARPDWLEVARQTDAFRMWRARYEPLHHAP